jgi:hypothetical protein
LGLTQPPSQPAPALHSWCSCHMGSSSSQRANTASECSHQCTVVQTKVTSYVLPSWHGHCCVAAPAHHLLYTLFGVGCLFVGGVWVWVSPPCGFACPVPCTILQVVRWAGQRQGTAGVDPQEGGCAAASLLLAAGRLRDYCILLCGGMACKVDRAGHMPHPVAPFNPPGTPEARCCVRYGSEVWCQVAWLPIPLLPPPQTHEGCGPSSSLGFVYYSRQSWSAV